MTLKEAWVLAHNSELGFRWMWGREAGNSWAKKF